MAGLLIRPATPDDESGILHCLAAAFEPYREAYTPRAFSDTTLDRSTLEQRMREMRVLVAIQDGQIVGTISASCFGGEGHLRGMAVLPDRKGTGIAEKLLSTIEEWLHSQSCIRVTLDTTEPLLRAMRFYEKHGYRKSGKISEFYGMPLMEYEKSL